MLAISFALVTSLIAALDRPVTTGFRVSQEPLIDVRGRIAPTHDDRLPGESK